jgi:hypothetical protein
VADVSSRFLSGVAITLLLAGFAFVFAWAIREQNKWEADCQDRGGHVDSHTDWYPVYGRDGTQHQESNTTYYCLGRDGQILKIR